MRNATYVVYKGEERVGSWTTDTDENITFASHAITHFFHEADIVVSEPASAYAKLGGVDVWAYLVQDADVTYPDPMAKTAQVDSTGTPIAFSDMIVTNHGAEGQVEGFEAHVDGTTTLDLYFHTPIEFDAGDTFYRDTDVERIAKAEKAPSKPYGVGSKVTFTEGDTALEGKITSHEEVNRTYRYTVHVPKGGDYDVHHGDLSKVADATCPLCHAEVEAVDGYGARTASVVDAYASCTACGALWTSWGAYEAQVGTKTALEPSSMVMGQDILDGKVESGTRLRPEGNESGPEVTANNTAVEADGESWYPKPEDAFSKVSSREFSAFDEAHNNTSTDWLCALAAKVEVVQNSRTAESTAEAFLDTLNLDQLSSADYVHRIAEASHLKVSEVESARRKRYSMYTHPVQDKTTVEMTHDLPYESIFR